MKDKVLFLLDYCMSLESKLDVLTTLGLSTNDVELFEVCEEIRSDLVETDSDLLY